MKIIHVFSYYASVCVTKKKRKKACVLTNIIKSVLSDFFFVRFPSFLLALFSPLKFLYVNGKNKKKEEEKKSEVYNECSASFFV